MQIDDLLITESQLSTRLNKSVNQNQRSEFGLLLAMLSHDALDFSQFHLPKTDVEFENKDNEQLRKHFSLGPEQLLAPEQFDMLTGQHNAKRLLQGGLSDIRLQQCLAPEPLAIRDDATYIPLNIIENCEPAVKKRYAQKDNVEDNPVMDAASFYDDLLNPNLHQPINLYVA